MRDGVLVANLGIPAVALVTEKFWPQGNFVAKSIGMPDVPRIQLPHPVAGTGIDSLKRIAIQIAPDILAALRGDLRRAA